MSSKLILNAAPMVIDYGTLDLSSRKVPRFVPTPQHVAKFFLFCEKGDTKPIFSSPNNLPYIFGQATWDERSKFFTHATMFAKRIASEGNYVMVQRVLPPDIGPKANIIMYLDVLPTTVDIYERNNDGSKKLDANQQPIIAGSAQGYKIKWVVSNHNTRDSQDNDFGRLGTLPGTQLDPSTGATSIRYPIYEFESFGYGSYANKIALRFRAPIKGIPDHGFFNIDIYNKKRFYPYIVNLVQQLPNGKLYLRADKLGVTDITFTTMSNVTDDTGIIDYSIKTGLIENFSTLNDPVFDDIYPEIGRAHIYQDNIDELLTMFFNSEEPYIDHHTELGNDIDEKYKINIITGNRPNGTPYHTIQMVDGVDSVRLGDNSYIYLRGGYDGTMNDTVLAELVSDSMYDYLDDDSEVMDIAYNVESVIYDSGFPLDTKYQLCNFISQRKDTFVILSTNVAGEEYSNRAQELAVGSALKSYIMMFPESDYFNTPVMRGMIVSGTGRIRNSAYKKRIPLTYEVAAKSARYMGAGNGAWVSGKNFDGAPGSIINDLYDISNPWVPTYQRNVFWQMGINWAQRYDRRSFFFPAFKTVYYDDTSVLNSYFTAMAICYLNKLAHAAWREFSGVSYMSNAQLTDAVNAFINNATRGKFDNRFVIIPEAYITDMDMLRGYSWTLPIRIYSPNMKTVMTTYVKAYNIEDLGTTTAAG